MLPDTQDVALRRVAEGPRSQSSKLARENVVVENLIYRWQQAFDEPSAKNQRKVEVWAGFRMI